MKGSIVAAGLVAAMAFPALAAGSEWQHTAVVYMIGAAIDGEAGVGDLTVPVDVSFDEILDNLDWGAMAAYRAERGPWAVGLDVLFMDLENANEGVGPNGRSETKADLEQLIVQGDAAYGFTERFGVYGGVRYWDVDAMVEVTGDDPLDATLTGNAGDSWFDPVIGVRYALPLGDKWTLVGKGDVGGFGIGSDFTWQATVVANWKLSDHTSLNFGYRVIDVDYDSGTGRDRFVLDVSEGGPAAGFAWRF